MPYVLSKSSADVTYHVFEQNPSRPDTTQIVDSVTIKGGANVASVVANPGADKAIVTPDGYVTEVTDDELSVLKNDAVFKEHMANGFITIVTDEKKLKDFNDYKPAKDMAKSDKSAPLKESDVKDGIKPVK